MRERLGARAPVLAVPWLLFGACLATGACGSGDPGSFDRVVVQRDLLTDIGNWRVLTESDKGTPGFGTLTPSYSAHHDSGDLPAILLPAGTAVAYTIPVQDGPAVLRCAAGVDLSLPRQLAPGSRPLRVHFEARLDDEPVLDLVVPVHPTEANRKAAKIPQVWHWLGGKQAGVVVRGGQTLTLRAELRGKPRPGLGDVRIGFGGLVTESLVSTSRTVASEEQPNIILVVVDTERADRTSLHGYHKKTTPNLERLGERGVIFDNAWVTAPWTWPSTASILTGLDPPSHGVTSHEACYLSHELPSLPKVLQARGFTTAAFSCNPLIVADKNFDAGFEHFESTSEFTPGRVIMPKVLAWLRENAGRRFFLYLHLVDPHDPHRPLASELDRLGGERPESFPEFGYANLGGKLRKRVVEVGEGKYDHRDYVSPEEESWMTDAYDACVATADVHLGQLLDLVEELRLDEKTVVAFTSDHGEELLEHGLTNHAHTLHPELMQVPLVIAGPGVPRGEHRGHQVSNRHLGPTLALCGGGELPIDGGLNLLSSDLEGEEPLYFHTTKGIWNDWSMVEVFGLLEDDWSFHWAPGGLPFRTLPDVDPGLGQWRLYDRRSDPGEQADVSREYPQEVERMRAQIQAWRESQRDVGASFGAGAATRSLLQGVGYIELDGDD